MVRTPSWAPSRVQAVSLIVPVAWADAPVHSALPLLYPSDAEPIKDYWGSATGNLLVALGLGVGFGLGRRLLRPLAALARELELHELGDLFGAGLVDVEALEAA